MSLLGHIVDIAYPAGDILLLGATIGVIALTGWRPGRAWYLLTLGLSIWVVADALYSRPQKVKETYVAGVYDYLWPLGLLVVAYAAWQPRVDHKTPEVHGWKAVLLPIVCQVVALVTQVWGLLATLGESERIMTIAVLTVVIVQLYVSRPRRVATVTTDPHLLPNRALRRLPAPTECRARRSRRLSCAESRRRRDDRGRCQPPPTMTHRGHATWGSSGWARLVPHTRRPTARVNAEVQVWT